MLRFLLLGVGVPVPGGGSELRIHGHAPAGGVNEVDPDVQNPLRATRGATNLQCDEANLGFAVGGAWQEAGNEDADGAYENVAEPCGGVDFDHDDGVLVVEEFFVNAENEFLVPGGVVVAIGVYLGCELSFWVKPRNCVGFDGFGNGCEVLCGYDVYFQELEWGS